MFFSVSGEHLWCHSTDGGVGPDSVVVITPGRPPRYSTCPRQNPGSRAGLAVGQNHRRARAHYPFPAAKLADQQPILMIQT